MSQAAPHGDALVQEIGRLAVREGLGRHRAAYPSIAAAQRRHAGCVSVGAVIVAVLAVISLATGYPALAMVLAVPLLIFLFAIVRYSGAASRNEGSRLDLYEHGLTIAHGGRVRAVRNADTSVLQNIVRHTRYGQTTNITYAYTVTDTTGEQMTLSGGFANPQEWGPVIQLAVTEAQFPQAADRIIAGQRLDFGPLWLTSAEIGSGDKSVPWPQIEEVSVQDGFVRVRVAGRWSSLTTTPVRRIPNFFIFRALTERLQR
ncbi:DUF6585 family protein [Streptomyces sp. NPDC059443]|uniref:DUF6585 family protein n=1 Tax=unclassified Streptomyces TaxID=2593676 RepID=UPI003688F6EF